MGISNFRGDAAPAVPHQVPAPPWRNQAGGGRAAQSGARRFAPVHGRLTARPLLESGQGTPVTFQKGSGGPLAARNPSLGDDPRRSENSTEAPRDTRGQRRRPRPAASPPRGKRPPPGLWPAPAFCLLRTGTGATEEAGDGGRLCGWKLTPSPIPRASCQARASGAGTVPPRLHRPARGQLASPQLQVPGLLVAHGRALEDTPGMLLQQHEFTAAFTALNFQIGLTILNFQTWMPERRGPISTQSEHVYTKT